MRIEFKRQIARIAKYVLIVLAGLYAIDWALFEARQLRGGAMGSVTVQKFLSTPLKGEKTEFDYLGTENDNCSQSLFPQYAASAWNPPCWWLARHKVKWQSTEIYPFSTGTLDNGHRIPAARYASSSAPAAGP